MEFAILGAVEARVDGRSLRLGGPKPRALLAMLLLNANEVVSRDRLIDGLWGEAPPPSAAHTLDDYVSRLRKELGADRIERRPPGYRLRVEPSELDLQRFEVMREQGRAQLAQGDAEDAAATFRVALGLWRGQALADILFEPFASLESERLEERRLSLLEDRLEADLLCGQGSALVGELEQLAREHPTRERLLGQLMLALYRSGRQTRALEVFQTARRQFAAELGLDPGPELRKLERQILEHDPTLQARADDADVTTGRHLHPHRRRRLVAGTLAAGAVAVAIAAGAIFATRDSSRAPGPPAGRNQIVGIDLRSGRVAASIGLSGAPAAMAGGSGSFWIADADANVVLRVDRASRHVVDRIALTAQPGAIVVGGGAVWVASTVDASVIRIDPSTGEITQRIPLGSSPSSLSFSAGELWVGDSADSALLLIDPATGTVRETVSLAVQPSAVLAGGGVIWIASYGAGTVTGVDPRTHAPIATVRVGQGPVALAFGAGAVWVANKLDGTVSRIDSQTASVTATVPTGNGPAALAFAGGKLWVANEFSGTVSRMDPAIGSVDATVRVSGRATSLAADGPATMWVGVSPRAVHRGGTLVLLASRHFLSIDPQVDDEAPAPEYTGLAYDGLVAYDHTAGANGALLVPDLALSLPEATDDGRTYVFRLRPGMRYSDGRPLRASDFSRAILRLFRVRSPVLGSFTDLVGGQACERDWAHCRLPRGVVTDDATRTVTFHLTAADPDFLFKLASGLVVPIPLGTPMRDIGSTPLPGTGPYRIAQDTKQEIRFVRNTRFREWSRAAQPDGNADQIVWRFGMTPAAEVRAIEQGHADWTYDVPPDLPRLAVQHPAQLHSNPSPTTIFVQINTRRPPFNDLRARRALNYAVDRASVVRMEGGPIVNTPTCQVIPPGLTGYRRYCPYTREPQANGIWSGPDLRRARALVAASGTGGSRVTIWTVSDSGAPEPGVAYLATLLRRLGYRAHYRIITTKGITGAPASVRWNMQLLPVGWGATYPSPIDFFAIFLACNGTFTWHQFCDRRLDRQIQQAESLRLTDPQRSAKLWARLDHETVDRAAWLPLVNQRVVDFVSTRLGGYQYNPVYHFLPAQAWLR